MQGLRPDKFTYSNVWKPLSNRRYIVESHFKDIVMPESIPAIVDKELFFGMCGAMMFGECGTGRNKVVHHYYKCANAKRAKICKKKTVRKEWLEGLVVAETMKSIQNDAVIDAIVAEVPELQEQENTTLPLLEKQLFISMMKKF